MPSHRALLSLLRSLFGRGGGSARPIFQEHDIFAGRLTEGLLHALLSDRGFLRSDSRVVGVEGSTIVIHRDGACGRLVLCPALGFGRDQDLPALSAAAARHAKDPSVTMVVVGGSEEFGGKAVEATSPLRVLHIDDAGRVRAARQGLRPSAPRLVIENALNRIESDLRDGAFPSIGFETARGLISEEADHDPRQERASHRVVTSALLFAMVACFLVQAAISRDSLRGQGAALSVAYRMGAIYPPAMVAGEWQRLIAAPFLHFGVLHIAMNGWAQWSLGAPVEFLIGPWRFLALWLGSALGASLTSFFFNEETVSAGASGAIFGLLGAFTTFVFFRKDILPQPVPRPLRNGVLATLLLNLMISFIPGIDMAAHAGGFVTGAIMAFALVRRDHGSLQGPAGAGRLRLVVALVVLVGVGLTSFQERADRSVRAPALGPDQTFGEVTLPVPHAFVTSRSRAGVFTTIEADGGLGSPFSVTYRMSEPQADDAAAIRVARSMRSGKAATPDSDPAERSEWIAVSQLGVQGLRAIEVQVVAPASCREEAERLVSMLAKGVR